MDPAVAEVRRAVREAIADLPSGALVLAAVSGGADSLALAAALAAEAPRTGRRAGAVTVDHGLQEGSAERAAIVASACKALGLDPVEIATVTVGGPGGTRPAGGPEAAARAARYLALEQAADSLGACAVTVGHTLDDQAETVLLGLARGSGARSLAGMAARRDRIIRPLLGVRRDTTVTACRALGIATWDDPHNADPSFARSRVRATVMPTLEAALGPGVADALSRTAALLRADADALDGWAASVADPTDAVGLAELPAAVRTRVLRRAAIAAGARAGALTSAHVDALESLVTDWHGQGPISLPGGLEAIRVCDRLSFR
ncbi:MAG TPA: tRNA lysidine(34) synthetase TilS [Mycobacteriales bacterium]|nr:tRNA lysidine(34) synthetase TilS [Mycobacteriales bacterium]